MDTGSRKPPDKTSVAAVIRAVDGPLAEVRGIRPEDAAYQGAAEHLRDVWVAVRASLRNVLESVTLADIVSGTLPAPRGQADREPGRLAAALSACQPPAPLSMAN